MASKLLILLISLLLLASSSSLALPLSVKSRWVVEEPTGERVKLACGNLVGHTEAMLPEGLSKQPLSHIARHIRLMGFNCVRLSYAVFMYTRYSNLTVVQRFRDLGLDKAIDGVSKYNPQFLKLTLVDAQKVVIDEFGLHGIMVLLDNQVSKPMWCCGDNDGNGFFGDKYFDPNEWLLSQSLVARRYKNTPMVVAMSLRNELRGPKQNASVWYHYMEKGAKKIHKENPNVLVLVSGLNYDLNFTFLKNKSLSLDFKNKLVYEYHRYSFSEGQNGKWENEPLDKMCDLVTKEIDDDAGFLFKGENGAPLLVSEFGVDEYGGNKGDNNYIGCMFKYLAENDLDFALWALQGGYYFRNNVQDPDEWYGMFNFTWSALRSPEFHSKMQFIQRKIQDPNAKESYLVLYHPLTSKCLKAYNNEIHATDCWDVTRYRHDGDGTPIKLIGTKFCLAAVGDGLPVTLTTDCLSEQSSWRQISRYQIANGRDEESGDLCLEVDPYYSPRLVTRKCIVTRDDLTVPENPQTQWISLVRAGSPIK